MTTNDALMRKLEAMEKQIQEQSKQMEKLITLFVLKQKVNESNEPKIDPRNFTFDQFQELRKKWMEADKTSLYQRLSNFTNNPLSQPEPCEETKNKLFGGNNEGVNYYDGLLNSVCAEKP